MARLILLILAAVSLHLASCVVLEEQVEEELLAKDWCNAEVFTLEGKMCCYGKINERPSHPKKNTHKCCGFQAYSNDGLMCCAGLIIQRPIDPDDPKPIFKCCGEDAFNSNRDMCCRGDILTRPSFLTGKDLAVDSCCGKIAFDQEIYYCRQGVINPYTGFD